MAINQRRFFEDLKFLLGKTGALDLIAFTGDIANRASVDEYDLASEFLDELGEVILANSDAFPKLALVPGNHDLDRSVPGKKLAKAALWSGWNNTVEDGFFEDDTDEVRLYARELFENYDRWATSSLAIEHVPLAAVGALPGDYSSVIEVNGQRIGILGLNSSYRHLNDEAVEGSLSLAPRQVHLAAGGDLQKWVGAIDFGLVLTHHPMAWMAKPSEANDALFGGESKIRAHLCGHLHEEAHRHDASGTERGRLVHQGQSLFGLERYGRDDEGSREHGYAILTFDSSRQHEQLDARVWPRRATRDRSGIWNLASDSHFGLPKGSESSAPISLSLRQKLDSPPVALPSPEVMPSTAAAPAPTEVPASLISHIAAGHLAVVLGDRFVTGSSGDALAFGSFRNILWAELGSTNDADPRYSTEMLMDQIQQSNPGRVRELVSDLLGNPTGATVRQARLLLGGPWASVTYLSPLRDLDQGALSSDDEESSEVSPIIDGTKDAFILPSNVTDMAVIRLAAPAPANGSNRLRIPAEVSDPSGPPAADWLRHSRISVTKSPVLFLTDSVDQLGIWNWISDRRVDNARFRLEGYLVCPSLAPHQVRALEALGVIWISSTVGDFIDRHFSPSRNEIAKGRAARSKNLRSSRRGARIDVNELVAAAPTGSKEYLLGRAPGWGDITGGFAAELSILDDTYQEILKGERRVKLVVGTAGSGRSTLLMQAAIRLIGESKRVAWIDAASSIPIPDLLAAVQEGAYEYVFVDDADVFGIPSGRMLDQLQGEGPVASRRTVVAGVRSVREKVIEIDVPYQRVEVGRLVDNDFDTLVKLLHSKRAIANKRASDRDVRDLLQDTADGQLLVGMIQATSGVPFSAKIASECAQLGPERLAIYGGAAIVAAERETVTEEQLLQMSRDTPQVAWIALQSLEQSGLLVREVGKDRFTLRHRVVAHEVRSYLQEKKLLFEVFARVLQMYAASAAHITDNSDANRRTLIRLMNHTYIISLGLSVPQIRTIYDSIEPTLENDFHYWLQRGAFEVERGDRSYAMHNLQSAMTIEGGERHFKVLTEFAMLRFNVAGDKSDPDAVELARTAFEDLLSVISKHGTETPHSIAVLAKQGIPWLEKVSLARSAKLPLADRAVVLLRVGQRLTATNDEIAAVLPRALALLESIMHDLQISSPQPAPGVQ